MCPQPLVLARGRGRSTGWLGELRPQDLGISAGLGSTVNTTSIPSPAYNAWHGGDEREGQEFRANLV